MRRGVLYPVAVMDWFTRNVLAWRISIGLETDFCVAAANEAIRKFGAGSHEYGAGIAVHLVCMDRPAAEHGRSYLPSRACEHALPGYGWTARDGFSTISSSNACGARSNTSASICRHGMPSHRLGPVPESGWTSITGNAPNRPWRTAACRELLAASRTKPTRSADAQSTSNSDETCPTDGE